MLYGLYLSANGVLANSFRQDVTANNLANAENAGFKRDTTSFEQRLTEAQVRGQGPTNPLLENLGGGLLLAPQHIDLTQGSFERTGNPLDVAVQGSGYFGVQDGNTTALTRDGQFLVDRTGTLVMADGSGKKVLDKDQKPIHLDSQAPISINGGGLVQQGKDIVATLGLFDVNDPSKLTKRGGSLLSTPEANNLKPGTGQLQSEFIEHANVDPTTEMTHLMDAQRQLEANANMIRYQDSTLGRLVNDVGKIS